MNIKQWEHIMRTTIRKHIRIKKSSPQVPGPRPCLCHVASIQYSLRFSKQVFKMNIWNMLKSTWPKNCIKMCFSFPSCLLRTELKKLIRKELRISTAVISDTDVENLAAALDGDRTGRVTQETDLDRALCWVQLGISWELCRVASPSFGLWMSKSI